MPQITYIDTETPRRERAPDSSGNARIPRRWHALVRILLRYRVAILLVFALYRFIGLGTGEMQQWDEAIYALRAQTIVMFGAVWDQSPFMLSGSYYSAHPPLYVWSSASLMLLFGDHLWVYRLTSALAAALMVPLLYRLSRLLQPTLRSLAAAGLFAVLPLPAWYSRLGQLDLLLTLFMTAAVYFAIRSLRFERAGDTLLAGVALGAALMTKLLFAFSVPAGVACSALLFARRRRVRALRVTVLMTLIALPLWLPWAWSFAATHGGGAGFLFSSSHPLGATLAGLEGSAKDTGAMYYVNQLVVNLSVLLPFALLSMWRSLRRAAPAGWTVATMTVLATLLALASMRSSFAVYLIPILPLLLLHAVRGVSLLRRARRETLLAYAIAAALLLPWSLFQSWRSAVKDVLRGLSGASLPAAAVTDTMLLLAATAAAVAVVWMLYRRNRLRPLLSLPFTGAALLVFAAVTAVRIWLSAPDALDDGARMATGVVRMSNAARVFVVGNGENPQLTFYLGGADIGWVEEERMRYERLEPHAIGVEGVRARIAARSRHGAVAVLVERDEITQGVYDSLRDILPPGITPRLRSGRYIIAGNDSLALPVDVK